MKNVMLIIDESNASYDLLIWALENQKDTIESSKVFIFATQPQNSFTPPTVLSSSVGFAQIFYPFSPSKSFYRLICWEFSNKHQKFYPFSLSKSFVET